MTSFYKNMEQSIRDNGDRGLELVEHYYGLDIELYRVLPKGDVFGQVHGSNDGKDGSFYKNMIGVITSDGFFAASADFSGNFDEGFLYTREMDLKPGDVLRIDSEDGKIRRYRIESKDNIGLTLEIFTAWKISNLGD